MNRKLLASAICASLLVAGTAFAQDTAPAQQSQDQSSSTTTQSTTTKSSKEKDEVKTLQKVTVTGSLLKRPEYQTTSPIQTVDIKADQAAGAFGTVNLLQSTAIAAGSTQINNQFSGFVIGGGTGIQTIDLRGLGANRTLVLLDGQRPGPSGVEGQTGAGFDLNVVPEVILQRIEIVKDGSSSIYGSDAISGVVNLITKKRMDHLEMTAAFGVPQHGGGEQVSASLGTGWNFKNGSVLVAAQFQEQLPVTFGDRDFLSCSQDRVWGKEGQRIDRKDLSPLKGTPYAGCNNLLQNEIISAKGNRYIPSENGTTVGPFPGWRPVTRGRYDDGNPNGGYYEEILNSSFYDQAWAINKNRNSSLYASSLFTFGNVNWTNQFLYNKRQTDTKNWGQFFPQTWIPVQGGGPEDACQLLGVPDSCGGLVGFTPGTGIGIFQPVMPIPSNSHVGVDYYYLRSQLDGGFGNSSWTWQVNGTHTRSDGNYSRLGIDARISGDQSNPNNTLPIGSTPFDVFGTCELDGSCMNKVMDTIGLRTTGNTIYTQSTLNAVVTGNLFTLPAGDVTAAVGAEYRHYKINDEPDPASKAGYVWGYSSAQTTKGADHVTEAFGEVGIPLLQGRPGFESLSVDLSARTFKYASVGERSNVWKYGLNWQITPTWRVRGTIGTSYRSPGLYELYLGNQSGFLSQTSIDPCIDWYQSTNDFLRANCAAAGVPDHYNGTSNSSAKIFQGGGKGFLTPETSRAKSLGVVWTPTFGNFNVAFDYFDYHVRGEIGTLSGQDIVFGCYGRQVYPNAFCSLFTRNPSTGTEANKIDNIHATFININSERNRGYDLQMNYSQDLAIGKLSADAEITYMLEDTTQLFSTAEASGFENSNRIGKIGSPRTVGLAHVSLKRGDWTYTWQGKYVSTTNNRDINDHFTYVGYQDAARDITAGWQFLHSVSVGYDSGKWGALFGIRNLFDKAPDLVSSGVATRYGNTPAFATQYDWFGRTFFMRAHYNF